MIQIARYFLLASMAATQLGGEAAVGQTAPTQASSMATNTAPDLAMRESLVMVQAMAQKSDADLARLRVSKWKTDAQNKQQSEANAVSIRRNLSAAVPDLLAKVQSEPNSLIANFRLYRNLNALYDSFSALVESAGAFGPEDQYTPLAADISQLDQIRHQFAQRVDLLAVANDAELARLRAAAAVAKPASANTNTKSGSKIVVDDSHPAPKKKTKPPVTKPATDKAAPTADQTPGGDQGAASGTNPAAAASNAGGDDSQATPKKKAKPSAYPPQQ